MSTVLGENYIQYKPFNSNKSKLAKINQLSLNWTSRRLSCKYITKMVYLGDMCV